ncbi:hypothetical protein SHIRM173S_12700 [Streptomyces hirsutus]
MTAAPDDHHADEPHADEPHADEPHVGESHVDEPHGGRHDRSGRRNRLDLEPDTSNATWSNWCSPSWNCCASSSERPALRRFDEGDLTEEQEERIGLTLMLLGDRMAELRDRYGLRPEDLNLDLGPLGPLLPRD